MDYQEKIVGAIEVHSVEEIRECFEQGGIHPDDYYKGQPLINELTSEYLRSNRFKDCVSLFLRYGMHFTEKPLLYVLMDDGDLLETALQKEPALTHRRYTLKSAFTPLEEVSLLHICAEFNHLSCAAVLLRHGADVNAPAGEDHWGFGGQSPIFHTVNQIHNHSREMMQLLLENNADLTRQLRGLIWGKGYDWETFVPSVNPISYAMMGLLPQMHRTEKNTAENISLLLTYAYGIQYVPGNIPNKYLGG